MVAELSAAAPDDRAFLGRLLSVIAQVAGARQALLIAVGSGGEGEDENLAEPRVLTAWPAEVGKSLGSGGNAGELAVESESEAKGAARAAASHSRIEVRGFEQETAFYDGSPKGYLVATPVPLQEAGTSPPPGQPTIVMTFLLDHRSKQALQTTLALVEVLVGYAHAHATRRILQRTQASARALDLAARLIASINAARSFKGAAFQLCNDLQRQLGVDRVAIGWVKGLRGGKAGSSVVKVIALSDTEHIDQRLDMVRKLRSAMEECLDQEQAVVFPPPPEAAPAGSREQDADVLLAQAITHAHRDLCATDARLKAASLPLRADEEILGVLTIETTGDDPVDIATVELLQAALDLVSPVLRVRRSDDRALPVRAAASGLKAGSWLVGPRHTAWKLLGVLVAAILITVTFVKVEYRVTSPMAIQPRERRVVAAPFEAILIEVADGVRPGAVVTRGQVLARLDSNELELSRLDAEGQMAEAATRADESLRAGRLAEAEQAQAQVDQAAARIALLERRIAQSVLTAPIDGTILTGDPRDRVGSSLKLGDALFEIATMDDMMVLARVEDRDIALIRDEQSGQVATQAFPGDYIDFEVERIVPLSRPDEGRNAFEVRGRIVTPPEFMRPGMEGIAKFNTGRRTLLDIGTRRIRDTLRLWLWW
ncbi:MAG: efflux RND transporter periplasmic adaptor subunit [Phycisphaerales bacterium]